MTGAPSLVVEDCGRVINPGVVDGQIRGGVAMGISGMLLEQIVYDGDGQCVTSTFMDYLLPTAADIPEIEIEHVEHEPHETLRSFGVGEGGTITAQAALTNALDDAILAAGGRRPARTPFTPAAVLEALGAIAPEDSS